jgi:hypothetical protein
MVKTVSDTAGLREPYAGVALLRTTRVKWICFIQQCFEVGCSLHCNGPLGCVKCGDLFDHPSDYQFIQKKFSLEVVRIEM